LSASEISSALAVFTLTGCIAHAQIENRPMANSVSSDLIFNILLVTPDC
jgi:hypothetical protein